MPKLSFPHSYYTVPFFNLFLSSPKPQRAVKMKSVVDERIVLIDILVFGFCYLKIAALFNGK